LQSQEGISDLVYELREMIAMQRAVLLVFVGVLCLPCHLPAQTDQAQSIQQAMFGMWKLVSYVREELPSGAKSDVMGSRPSGYINYGRDGRMIVIIVGSHRTKPVGEVATPEEAEALIKSMVAYAGTYTIDGEAKAVTHHIEISWDQSRTGTNQVRSYKLEGNHLTLTTEPSTDPATGKKTVRTLIWER
jgi:hypothetical protein